MNRDTQGPRRHISCRARSSQLAENGINFKRAIEVVALQLAARTPSQHNCIAGPSHLHIRANACREFAGIASNVAAAVSAPRRHE